MHSSRPFFQCSKQPLYSSIFNIPVLVPFLVSLPFENLFHPGKKKKKKSPSGRGRVNREGGVWAIRAVWAGALSRRANQPPACHKWGCYSPHTAPSFEQCLTGTTPVTRLLHLFVFAPCHFSCFPGCNQSSKREIVYRCKNVKHRKKKRQNHWKTSRWASLKAILGMEGNISTSIFYQVESTLKVADVWTCENKYAI